MFYRKKASRNSNENPTTTRNPENSEYSMTDLSKQRNDKKLELESHMDDTENVEVDINLETDEYTIKMLYDSWMKDYENMENKLKSQYRVKILI